MAGILGKIPCCNEHGKPCFIKTGTKDGPMKGKTFFICSNQSGQCSFVEPASGIPVTNCPHHNEISDLQALCKKQDGMRCYFRCTEGRKMQLGWCGFTKISPVVDRNNTQSGVAKLSERNPLENSKALSVQPTVSISKHPNKPMVAISGKENKEPFLFKDASESNDQNQFESISSGTREDTVKDLNQAEISRSCANVRQGKEPDKVTSVPCNKGKVSEIQTLVSGQWPGFSNRQSNDINATSSNVPAVSSKTEKQRKASSDVIIIDDSYEDHDESGDISRAYATAEQINHQQKLFPNQGTTKYDEIGRVPDCCRFADERSLLLSKQSSLQMQIQIKKKLMQTVNMRALPDGGQRILEQIRDLETKLKEAKQMCDKLPSDHSCDAEKNDAIVDILHAGKDRCPVNGQLDSELFFVSSKGSGSVGDHFQTQRLYDGKMTQSKLKEVGKITKDAIETLHSSLETCPSATTEHEDPKGLLVTLLPHQRQALAWLLWREKQTPSGGILADDMGLGKTLTSIALILLDKQLGFTKKSTVSSSLRNASGTLVVCPASLVHHWKKEIDKRVKPLKITVCLYHGPTREKSADRLARYDVVLTTYSIVEREAKDLVDSSSLKKKKSDAWLTTKGPPPATDRCKRRDSPLCQVHWRRIILDEAHTIKNPKCMTSMAACCLEAESRWALTGTPIQNNTKDLYAIIKFLRCSPFDEFKVWTKWVDDKSSRGTARMNTIVRSLLLRRTKEQHLTCLPTRDSVVHNISLRKSEKEVYDILQLYSKNMLKTYLDSKGGETRNRGVASQSDAARDDKQDILNGKKLIFGKELLEFLDMVGILKQDINAGTILLLVLRLRQCCSHLSLLLQVPDDTECNVNGIDISLEDHMMNMSIVDSSSTEDQWSPSELKESFVSSKIHCLLQELHKLKHLSSDGKPIKSVIVSQWTRMLDVIAYHLRNHGLKYDFITGSVSLKKRSEIVDEFNDNPYGIQIMLVSLKAGGVGLNLIGGSHLFLIDQHWNPALEAQASDRIYRVGQKNDVVIHRFLCVDTIEEKIAALQEKKKALADSVLKGSKDAAKSLTLQDLRMLFGV